MDFWQRMSPNTDAINVRGFVLASAARCSLMKVEHVTEGGQRWKILLEGGADWVRLLGYYGCATKLDPLRRFLMVDVCAEWEALRMGIERLTVLFPTEFSMFDFNLEKSGRTVQ